MIRLTCLLCSLILTGTAIAVIDDPTPVPVPAKPGLIFPMFPGAITPDPNPRPNAPVSVDTIPLLTSGQWYVVQSDTEFFLVASPAKQVTVQYEQGPLRAKGIFVDGTGKVETRTYAAKYLAIVDVVDGTAGRVELIGIPAGVTEESSITRRLIDIGVAPIPPPIPPPVPKPVTDTFKDEVTAFTATRKPPNEECLKVAAAFRAIAAEIEAGSITTREQLTHRTSDAIVERIGLNAFIGKWVPWRDDLTAVLKKKSLATIKDHANAWNTVAEVLEQK